MKSLKKDKKDNGNIFKAYTFLLQFTINMVVPIAFMTALGMFIDNKAGTSCFSIILFFVGAVAGGQNVYRMAKSLFPDKRPEYEEELEEYRKRKASGPEKDERKT